MAVVEQKVSLSAEQVERVQRELRAQGLGAWLLYNFHGSNPVASQLLGLPAMTRRYWVLVPVEGRPMALTHRIEQQPWEGWIGEKRVYLSWRELEKQLGSLLSGVSGRVAMEYAPNDAVPYVDKTPAGMVELVRGLGAEVASSADLISAFYSRWSERGLESHRQAARILQDTAHAAFRRVGEQLARGETPTEWALRGWVKDALRGHGLTVGTDAIVAVNAHAANPHFAPTADDHAPIRTGDLLLLDLYGREDTEHGIYADQTWMAWVGPNPPERVREIWYAVRDAREAAVELARTRWAAGERVAGCELDDAARGVIRERGWGDAFIHRTGHSIDRELHGSGPNLDNLETRDTRTLIQGVGFSVEPGIYLPGDVGFRSEIDVYMNADGPEVTTPDPQRELVEIGDGK